MYSAESSARKLTGRWTQGGKLPGLRGGPDKTGCSGGNQPDGTSCFSTRLMWRGKGAGEGQCFFYKSNLSISPTCELICARSSQ